MTNRSYSLKNEKENEPKLGGFLWFLTSYCRNSNGSAEPQKERANVVNAELQKISREKGTLVLMGKFHAEAFCLVKFH